MSRINKKIIQEVMGKLPPEQKADAVRDISFLSCSIFTDTHQFSFRKFFNFSGFSIIYWFVRPDGNVVFYRSWKEYDLFAEKVGRKYLQDFKFARRTADTLIRMSDDIENFIKKNDTLEKFLAKKKYFITLYRDFFAFHQAAFWPLEYLSKNKDSLNKKKIDKIAEVLGRAYRYNEMVVPDVEKYFSKLKIADLLPKEISSLKKRITKNRSILLLNKKIYILSVLEAKKINQALARKRNKYEKQIKDLKGFGAYPGRAVGKVEVINNYKDFKNLRSGNILVTAQTRPQYNFFLKKVKAIITDEGGLLCHAAILAREFKIPAIVGTKIATKVLRDGMTVEVDANKGIIKIIK